MKKMCECDVTSTHTMSHHLSKSTIITFSQPLGHFSQLFIHQSVYFIPMNYFYKEQIISTPNSSVWPPIGFQPFFEIFKYFDIFSKVLTHG